MILIRLYDEGDCWDVIVQQSGDEILTFEFETKKDAVDFAHRAADFFSDFFDVKLIKRRSSPASPGDGDSNQFGFRGRC